MKIETDKYGAVFVITEQNGVPHRRPIPPGSYVSGVWVDTDASGETAEVQAVAAAAWTPDVVAAYQTANPYIAPPPPTLPVLAPYQFFSMLDLSGKKPALDAFINALPSPQNVIAKNKLEHTLEFHRDNDLVLAAQTALKLTDAELDALWIEAATL